MIRGCVLSFLRLRSPEERWDFAGLVSLNGPWHVDPRKAQLLSHDRLPRERGVIVGALDLSSQSTTPLLNYE
jgi:hypothetical protein